MLQEYRWFWQSLARKSAFKIRWEIWKQTTYFLRSTWGYLFTAYDHYTMNTLPLKGNKNSKSLFQKFKTNSWFPEFPEFVLMFTTLHESPHLTWIYQSVYLCYYIKYCRPTSYALSGSQNKVDNTSFKNVVSLKCI